MRRPAGVIISCIVLGFIACILLLTAVMFIFLSTMMGHIPLPTPPGQPAPDPAIHSGVMIAMGLVCLIPTIWGTVTIVGLARMKTWARYSIMVIGGGLVLFSLLGLMGIALTSVMLASPSIPTGQSPEMLRIGMIINGLFELAVMGVGIWWLVYFAMRSTREAFRLATPPAFAPVSPYPLPPSPYASSTYEVAAYILPPDPNAPPIPDPVAVQPQISVDASPSRPISITVIAVLLLIGSAVTIPLVFLPFPLFLFGTPLTGWPAHLAMASFAILGILTGIGLLRLEKIAFYSACGFYIFGLVNSALILLPSVRERMIAYQTALMQRLSGGMPQPVIFDSHMMAFMLLPGFLFTIVFCAVFLILLIRSRAAFDRPRHQAAA